VEERREERDDSFALMQAPSWARMHMQWWTQIASVVRGNRKEKNFIDK